MARKRVLHRHVDQDFRLHQGTKRRSNVNQLPLVLIQRSQYKIITFFIIIIIIILGYVHTVLAVGQSQQRKLRRSQYISITRRRVS